MPPSPEGHVFIATYGRSGSTLLQNVLNAIPGYLIRGENDNMLYHLARAWMVSRDSPEIARRREARRQGTTPDPRYGTEVDPWFGAELINPPELGRRLAMLFTNQVLKPAPDTRVAGFKEIRFHLAGEHMERYLDFMLNFFPGAKIVFNTRDLAAVKKSGWWANYSQEAFLAEVGDADRRFRAYAQAHPKRAIVMHYDDYKGKPEAFRPLFDFLDEPYDRDHVASVIGQQLDHLKT